MQYLAISTGSLVRALNRNGMMMSVFTSSGQTHVRPLRTVGAVIGISLDPRSFLRSPTQRRFRGVIRRSFPFWLPYGPPSFWARGVWRTPFLRGCPDGVRHKDPNARLVKPPPV